MKRYALILLSLLLCALFALAAVSCGEGNEIEDGSYVGAAFGNSIYSCVYKVDGNVFSFVREDGVEVFCDYEIEDGMFGISLNKVAVYDDDSFGERKDASEYEETYRIIIEEHLNGKKLVKTDIGFVVGSCEFIACDQ